jgi:hypothetical protein
MAKRFAGAVNGRYAAQSSAGMQQDQALLPPAEIARNISAKEMRHRVETQFRRIAENEDVTSTVLSAPGDGGADDIVAAVRCADLSIFGQPDIDNDPAGFQRRLVENALLGGGAPLLVVPRGVLTNETGTNVLVERRSGSVTIGSRRAPAPDDRPACPRRVRRRAPPWRAGRVTYTR